MGSKVKVTKTFSGGGIPIDGYLLIPIYFEKECFLQKQHFLSRFDRHVSMLIYKQYCKRALGYFFENIIWKLLLPGTSYESRPYNTTRGKIIDNKLHS